MVDRGKIWLGWNINPTTLLNLYTRLGRRGGKQLHLENEQGN